jgi:hypothetical protein
VFEPPSEGYYPHSLPLGQLGDRKECVLGMNLLEAVTVGVNLSPVWDPDLLEGVTHLSESLACLGYPSMTQVNIYASRRLITAVWTQEDSHPSKECVLL